MSQPYDRTRPDASAGVRDSGTGAVSGPSARSDRAQAIAGPFTLRDAVVGGSVLVMLIGSLIPYFTDVITYRNMWTTFPLFFQGIGILLPLIVAGLFAFRRLSPKSHIRIGSLSTDQFASVVAVLAAIFFFLETASAFNASVLIALIGSLGLLAATTFAPFIPGFAPDFFGRKEIPAHLIARDAIVPEPKPVKPAVAAKPAAETGEVAARPSATAPGEVAASAKPAASVKPSAAAPGASVGQAQTSAEGHAPSGSGAREQATERKSDSAYARPKDSADAGRPSAKDSEEVASASSAKTQGTQATAAPEAPAASDNAASESITPTAAQIAAKSRARKPGAAEAEAGTSETSGSTTPKPAASNEAATPAVTVPDEAANPAAAVSSEAANPAEKGPSSGADYTAASDVNAEAEHSGPSAATSTDGPGHDNSSSSQPATAVHPVIAHEPAREPISATRSHEEEPVIEAFWFAVGSGRPVVHESSGKKLFTFEPGDWELCLEDRGNEFLVQNKHTGQTGIMKDLSDIQIPPAEDPSSRRG